MDYYWNALHCIKHNNGCPGSEWSRWTPWTDCTVSCGQGLSERERECIVEVSQVTQRTLLPTCYGYHIRRRKRDKVLLPLITKSHGCVGSYKEIRPCYLNDCPVNGGWSEWEPWSQCSAGCGLGTQSRSRACSSPPVLGGGQPCIGPITHLRHCFVQPCKCVTHEVAVFLGDGSLSYLRTDSPIRLLHIYLKFKSSTDSGELIRREPLTKDFTKKSCCFVRLFLEAGYLVLSARMSRCYLSLITVQKIEHEKWTEVLIMITPSGATMRLDNRSMYYKAKFNCVLRNPNFDSDMVVGYDFKGEIEKLAVNFKKRNLRNSDNLESQKFPVSNISPVLITNVEYNEGEQDESLITLDNLILGPCPKNMKSWSIELVVKTQAAEGAVLVIKDYFLSTFLILLFETHRISLHLASGDCDTEVDFNTDAHLNVWTYIVINYNESECIGFRINGGRRKKLNECNDSQELSCKDHMYLGDVAPLLKKAQMTNFSYMKYVDSMIGTLAYLRIDDEVLDLESLPSRIELETEPFSNNYTELELPFGEQLNLSCLYYLDLSSNDVLARQYWNQSQPFWLKFDTPIDIKNNGTRDIQFDVYDNNRVSQLKTLHYKSREDIEGFYSCWLPYPKKSNGSEILFTYGVSVIQSSLEKSSLLLGISSIFFPKDPVPADDRKRKVVADAICCRNIKTFPLLSSFVKFGMVQKQWTITHINICTFLAGV
uniref:Laminin G domain-containing protein n=1 Tax=Rhodnius prolixus TaxID=13249 RepID=T1I7N6_RHOPR